MAAAVMLSAIEAGNRHFSGGAVPTAGTELSVSGLPSDDGGEGSAARAGDRDPYRASRGGQGASLRPGYRHGS